MTIKERAARAAYGAIEVPRLDKLLAEPRRLRGRVSQIERIADQAPLRIEVADVLTLASRIPIDRDDDRVPPARAREKPGRSSEGGRYKERPA